MILAKLPGLITMRIVNKNAETLHFVQITQTFG